MALARYATKYAPDVHRALNGILVLYKAPGLSGARMQEELLDRVSDQLNQLKPRPIARRLQVRGALEEPKEIVDLPNLADHPLVVGPRYVPWELPVHQVKSRLEKRCSGVSILLLGTAINQYSREMDHARFVSVYHITGRFGHITDTYWKDGKVIDKSTYKHVRPGRLDSVLSRIESSQKRRLYQTAAVAFNSEEGYQLAKAWPSRPPSMGEWPVIYRLRCIHLKLPEFKLEATVVNEDDQFLASICNDVGLMLKSGAYCEAVRRIQQGPFKVEDSLTDREWDLQFIVNNIALNNSRKDIIHKSIRDHLGAMLVRSGTEIKDAT